MDQTGHNIIDMDLPVSSIDDLDLTAINVLGRAEAVSDSLFYHRRMKMSWLSYLEKPYMKREQMKLLLEL